MDAPPTMKRLNWKAIGILAAVTAVVGTTVHFVHAHQVQQNAHILAEEAAAAEQAGNPAEAADRLSQYLQLRPEDTDARAKRGLLMAQVAKDYRAKKNAYVILSQALQADP